MVVETTVLDIERGQPATEHVMAALRGGAHVVTANKGPVAFAYREIMAAAQTERRRFLFEGAVMDGIPVFNLVRETLPAVDILGFRGVINTTTNYILTAMEAGRTFDEALAEMQAAGIAEADPSFDVDGWDAAAKTAALVNVLMRGAVTPRTIDRTGIRGITPEDMRNAVRRGKRIRLVASAERRDGQIAARVAPVELDASRPARQPRRQAEPARPRHRHARADRHPAAGRRPRPDGVRAALRPGHDREGPRPHRCVRSTASRSST